MLVPTGLATHIPTAGVGSRDNLPLVVDPCKAAIVAVSMGRPPSHITRNCSHYGFKHPSMFSILYTHHFALLSLFLLTVYTYSRLLTLCVFFLKHQASWPQNYHAVTRPVSRHLYSDSCASYTVGHRFQASTTFGPPPVFESIVKYMTSIANYPSYKSFCILGEVQRAN